MPNQLIISVAEFDTRVALVEDGRLAEFYLERHRHRDISGNIYKGRVMTVLPGMAAAFIDIGLERPGYLFVGEVTEPWEDFFTLWLKGELPEGAAVSRRVPPAPIEDLLREGQELLVQVVRPPAGNKGARLTAHVSLPGHYLVYLPTLAHLGVSRRIADEAERIRLKSLLEELKPEGGGLIARTASLGQDRERLAQERNHLANLWQQVQRQKENAPAPSLLHQELVVALRAVRDLFTQEVDRLIVDDPQAYEQILAYLATLNPHQKYRLELYSGPEPIFSHFGLEIDYKRLLAPRVWLKSGGYLLIEATEALTAIDVNTGRFVGRHDPTETILQTNLEAAREVARQLRLRNIGGLIVIDFIDLERPAHREVLHQTLVEALKRDRAKTTALPMSPLGLVEMTRQRLRDSLAQSVTEPCGCCSGRGVILTPLALAHDLLRQLAAEAREFPGGRLTVTAHPAVTAIMKEEGKGLLDRLAKEHRVIVQLTDQPQYSREYFEIIRELG
jgi:ribonuclease G